MDPYLSTIALAESFEGATWPNPPVAAVAINSHGEVLGMAAHEFSGEPHAEARVLHQVRDPIDTLFVTLEPCNHTGKTPPCTEAILGARPKRVLIGARDPNPRVVGGGAARLAAEGIEVQLVDGPLEARCARLIAPFRKWVTTGQPWVCVKSALRDNGSRIPAPGAKTFSSPASLVLAHHYRRRSGAILTGSGTVLADGPEFTVRHLPDHVRAPRRWLGVIDRRGRLEPLSTARPWIECTKQHFHLRISDDPLEMLAFFGSQGVHRVLVEAGPGLAPVLLPVADEQIEFHVGPEGLTVIKTTPCSQES